MTESRFGGLAAAAFASVTLCAVLAELVGGDPMLAFEIGALAVATAWVRLAGLELVGSRRVLALLSADAHEITLFGVSCRVTPVLGADAVVVGFIRPRIFVGPALIDALTDDELKAVMYHEDHHRRTRAPLRAAALGAWMRLLGRSSSVRDMMLARLADLETLADGDAIRRGSSPVSIARALLKGDLSPRPVAFSYAAERRVEHLLDRAAGRPAVSRVGLPVEWLPVVLVAGVALGCHLRF
ncbi:MAG: hypothetical protein V4515_07420 [Chloroflexota bacterium]